MERRNTLKAILAAPFVALGLHALQPSHAVAAPNGTAPTVLRDLQVVATSATSMRISGRYTTLNGAAIPGMEVIIYRVGTSFFSIWGRAYTGNDGRFTWSGSKVPVGSSIQVEVVGNGAYSRPYPTFNRP